jgi:hypothetical protein
MVWAPPAQVVGFEFSHFEKPFNVRVCRAKSQVMVYGIAPTKQGQVTLLILEVNSFASG